jgi:type IV pilus assembly protein PilW
MSAFPKTRSRSVGSQRGFTLVELMVTISIALFLLGGLARIVQNVRQTYGNQQLLAQLQDTQRFAMTVITDVVQSAGYFVTPNAQTLAVALPAGGVFATNGQALYGTHPGGATPDTLQVRYNTAINDGVILCDGSSNTTTNPNKTFTNIFTVANTTVSGVTAWRLWCSVNNTSSPAAPGVALAMGVQNMVIYYGVKRNVPLTVDYNIDTYLTANVMSATDWMNVTSVKIQLTFANPLFGQTTTQPATIVFERIIPVMGRAGIHT